MYIADFGTRIFSKSLTSSAITTGGVDFARLVGNGIIIEDVIAVTDTTGLATGTNFSVTTNAAGSGTIYTETVANLGANATVELADASVASSKQVITTGKKLTAKSTVASCTGAGTVTLYIKYRKLDEVSELVEVL